VVAWFLTGLGLLVVGVGLVVAGVRLHRVSTADVVAARDGRVSSLVLGVGGVGLVMIGIRLIMPN
jgi:uncharacterized membrane protein YidH (DUF202 family)